MTDYLCRFERALITGLLIIVVFVAAVRQAHRPAPELVEGVYAGEVIPIPEPTAPASIPPLPTIGVPIAPRTDRAWLPVVFGGGECVDRTWYFCEVAQ